MIIHFISRAQAYFTLSPAETTKLPWPKFYEDSPDEFDNGNPLRRVIMLGDGSEVLADIDDADMFDDVDSDEEELEKRFPGFRGEETVIGPSNGAPEVLAESS